MILNNALQVVKKQKIFTNRATKDFASGFIKQIAKLIEVLKTKKEKQKLMPLQLSAPLNKPKFQSFFNKNETDKKIINTKAVLIAKADQL